jgi:hypothetical protein
MKKRDATRREPSASDARRAAGGRAVAAVHKGRQATRRAAIALAADGPDTAGTSVEKRGLSGDGVRAVG